MKRYIRSATRSPETALVYEVCDAMDWNYPMFKNRTKDGYACKWGGRSLVSHEYHRLIDDGVSSAEATKLAWEHVQDDVAEIEKRTGVICTLTPSGNLVIPYGGK